MPSFPAFPPERHAALLDVAGRLFFTRGYETTPLEAIFDEVESGKGAFEHYYDSKPALLEAVVERMVAGSIEVVRPILVDPDMGALEKFNRFFRDIGTWKSGHREQIIATQRALDTPANAPLKAQIDRQSIITVAPVLALIIQQGADTGVFDVGYPLAAARIVLELSIGLGRVIHDGLLMEGPGAPGPDTVLAAVDAFHASVAELLGTPVEGLHLLDKEQLRALLPSAEGAESPP